MNVKSMAIFNSIGAYPPNFVVDYSHYRNCYAHALNCMYEDRDYSVYSPGAITATFNESDIFYSEDCHIYFREDLYLKLIKRDCSMLGIDAQCCSYGAQLAENAYKIVLAYSNAENDFHFIRQNADGLWSHKPGFGSRRHPISSEYIQYHGETQIEVYNMPYKVIEVLQLKRRVGR